jgi:peptide/nickel transport system substrate-binding protein
MNKTLSGPRGRLRNAAAGALLLLLAVALAACGSGSKRGSTATAGSSGDLTSTNGIQKGGTLRVGFSEAPVDLDPQTSTNLGDAQILENIYRGLTRYKSPTDLEIVGDIAESWTVSPDELTWTFKLRPGVKFHNGREVTADDVKFSIDRIRDPHTVATARSDFEPVKGVQVVDPRTVAFHLKRPYSILPEVLQIPAWSAIIPKEAVAQLKTEPVGTGPFKFKSSVRNTSLTLERFSDYWNKPKPLVDQLVFTFIPDENARVEALRSGQVDLIDSVPLAQAKVLQKNPSLSVASFGSSWVDEFGMNTKRKPLDDVRVRQAIAYALNKDEITKAATFGLGKPADTMVAPVSPIKLDAKGLPYDPARAKDLLKQAGLAGGFDMEFAPCGGDAFPQMRRAGQVIASELQAVGIRAKLTNLEAGIWVDKVITKHDYDAFICGLINGLDPDGHSYRYFRSDGAFNFSQYAASPQLDRLLDEGRQVRDAQRRGQIYSQAWTMINRDVPWISLYSVPGIVAGRQNVRGFEPFPELNMRLETVGFASKG